MSVKTPQKALVMRRSAVRFRSRALGKVLVGGIFQVWEDPPPVAACANVRDRSAGRSAPGVDLCSPVDEPARQSDRLRRVALRHRGGVVPR